MDYLERELNKLERREINRKYKGKNRELEQVKVTIMNRARQCINSANWQRDLPDAQKFFKEAEEVCKKQIELIDEQIKELKATVPEDIRKLLWSEDNDLQSGSTTEQT